MPNPTFMRSLLQIAVMQAVFLGCLATGLKAESVPNDLPTCAEAIARELGPKLGGARRRVIVADFTRLPNEGSLLGVQLAEELTAALVVLGGPVVVERRLLPAALRELRLGASDLFEPSAVKRIGRFVGADILVTGGMFAGNGITVVAKAIRIDTGEIVASVRSALPSSRAFMNVLATPAPVPSYSEGWIHDEPEPEPESFPVAKAPQPEPEPVKPAVAGPAIILNETFSSYAEGTAPPGWLGTAHFAVTADKRGAKSFQAFEPGASRFTVPGLHLPADDFFLEWVAGRTDNGCLHQPHFVIEIGDIKAGAERSYCTQYEAVLGNSRTPISLPIGTPITFQLRKEGDVFSLWIDGQRVLIARKTDFTPGDRIVINLDGDAKYSNHGVLYSVFLKRGRR